MVQEAHLRAFKCFTVFVVETIFPCAEHVLIKCPSDIQVIFSVVRTKWLFHFPLNPRLLSRKVFPRKSRPTGERGGNPFP